MIKDKIVIITGASSGIGEATARLLASKGAKLVLGARREDKLERIADIRAAGGEAIHQELDVTDASANQAIVDRANSELGRLDVIFLNAGVMPSSPLSALKTDEWHQMVDVNIKGVLNGVAAVLPTFVAQKSGHIIANSSVAGLKTYPGGAVYGGTKWFVRDFMEVLRMESAMEGTNIRTATIYPTQLSGAPVQGRLFDFAPVINRFLRTHLFGDIFERDNLDWKSRELATVGALAAMAGVEPQLRAHMGMSLRVGLTAEQLRQVAQLLTKQVETAAGTRANDALAQALAAK